MSLKSKKGFSLVELIIVIAILGIIALIAVPNLTGIQQRSQINADIRTAEQIGKAIRIWRIENPTATDIKVDEWVEYDTLSVLSPYIALTYAPSSKVEESGATAGVKETGSYFVRFSSNVAGQEAVWIAIGKDGATVDPELVTEYTNGKTGVAYVEGISDLTTYLPTVTF